MGIVDQTSYNVKTLFSDIELDSTRILDFTWRVSDCEELEVQSQKIEIIQLIK